ncbi:MAG: hypothetical protein ACKVW3_14810 [Phycisphaerales bacterium]
MKASDARRFAIGSIALATLAGGLILVWRSVDHVTQLSTAQILATFALLLLPPLTCVAWLLDRRAV